LNLGEAVTRFRRPVRKNDSVTPISNEGIGETSAGKSDRKSAAKRFCYRDKKGDQGFARMPGNTEMQSSVIRLWGKSR